MNTVDYKRRLNEVFLVEPNDLGNPLFTSVYKRITRGLKTTPFIYLIPLSLIISLLLYLIGGSLIVRVTTFLQNGF